MITRPEFDRWIEILETAELSQTTGQLKQLARVVTPEGVLDGTPEYCCLGVYCEMIKGYEWNAQRYSFFAADAPDGTPTEEQWNTGLAPKWEINDNTQRCLTLLNDGGWINANVGVPMSQTESGVEATRVRPHSFREIAAFLRHKGYEWIIREHAPEDSATFTDLPRGFEL
jgi:hypothetical protein